MMRRQAAAEDLAGRVPCVGDEPQGRIAEGNSLAASGLTVEQVPSFPAARADAQGNGRYDAIEYAYLKAPRPDRWQMKPSPAQALNPWPARFQQGSTIVKLDVEFWFSYLSFWILILMLL
jgi:hypothetical protein